MRSTAEELSTQAEQLQNTISFFKVKQTAAAARPAARLVVQRTPAAKQAPHRKASTRST